VCCHSILLIAVSIRAGENWRLATMLLWKMLLAGICPITVLYDINCRYAAFFMRWLAAKLFELSLACQAAALAIFFPLPPFHAYMHSAACRQGHSLTNPRFPTFCQPCGEPTESYWSQLNGLARLRTATLEYGTITIENVIASKNRRQRNRLSSLVAKRIGTLQRRIVQEQQELADFMEEVASQEVWKDSLSPGWAEIALHGYPLCACTCYVRCLQLLHPFMY
jgi:hypothetical protein